MHKKLRMDSVPTPLFLQISLWLTRRWLDRKPLLRQDCLAPMPPTGRLLTCNQGVLMKKLSAVALSLVLVACATQPPPAPPKSASPPPSPPTSFPTPSPSSPGGKVAPRIRTCCRGSCPLHSGKLEPTPWLGTRQSGRRLWCVARKLQNPRQACRLEQCVRGCPARR